MRCIDCRFFHENTVLLNGAGVCDIELPPHLELLLRRECVDKTTFSDCRCDLGKPNQKESA